jgi:ATP-dependent Clp protease ATP-binding subunit ClpA
MDRINRTVFELFTSNARQVVVNASSHVRELGHEALAPEHLLLGTLTLERGVAHDVLVASGLGLDEARGMVVRHLGQGTLSPAATTGQVPFSSAAKDVLDGSLAESRALGHAHEYVGSGHVLLALLVPGSDSGTLVETLGHDLGRLRAETVRLLRSQEPGA